MRLEDICTVFTDGDWIESKDQSESGIRLVQSKRQIMRLVELTFLCQTLKNTKKLIVF